LLLVAVQLLIQDTAQRAVGAGFAGPFVACSEVYRFLVAEQLLGIGPEGSLSFLESFAWPGRVSKLVSQSDVSVCEVVTKDQSDKSMQYREFT
jgi:hypothetical protein